MEPVTTMTSSLAAEPIALVSASFASGARDPGAWASNAFRTSSGSNARGVLAFVATTFAASGPRLSAIPAKSLSFSTPTTNVNLRPGNSSWRDSARARRARPGGAEAGAPVPPAPPHDGQRASELLRARPDHRQRGLVHGHRR